jgi:quinol monooxygenase YgiN
MSIHVLIRHDVADFDDWKAVFDEHDETRAEYGQTGYELLCEATDAEDVCILIQFEDEDRARAFLESDDLRMTMEQAGVTSEPEVTFLKLVDEKHLPHPAA